jgi:translation elongation factor EF-1alpha
MDEKIFPSYKGGSLIETLDSLDIKHPHLDGPLRIPVIDKYKDGGNFVILGKIESGTLKRKDKIIIMPGKLTGVIHKIHLHHMVRELIFCEFKRKWILQNQVKM